MRLLRAACHGPLDQGSKPLSADADIVVANAGFGAPTRLDPLNTADVERTIRVNVLGVIYSIEGGICNSPARSQNVDTTLAILQPGCLQGSTWRVGLLCQQCGGECLHGGPEDCLAVERNCGDNRVSGLCRHADDAHELRDAFSDVG